MSHKVLRKCDECDRVFNIVDEFDRDEFFFGHDCEV
jgi:hypothetical protein